VTQAGAGESPIACPSAPCAPGAVLVGIALSGGRIAYASDRIVVDDEFLRAAQEQGWPERRFRFSTPCARAACSQWTGSQCGVIETVLDATGSTRGSAASIDEQSLPACVIRPRCRWFLQRGTEACGVCPIVVTDTRDDTCGAHTQRGEPQCLTP